jgi:uncharacterized protein YkwD
MRALFVVTVVALGAAVQQDPTDKLRESMFDTINTYRTKAKVEPLVRNAKLDAAAQKHAENMAKQEKLAHELDGKRVLDRVQAEEYAFLALAENCGESTLQGKSTPAQVIAKAMRDIKDSPGHYANIISGQFSEIGVGVARGKSGRWYICQVFAAPKQ